MSESNSADCVLIAGAGPVGLTLALCLAEAGLTVQIFEAEADISEDLRASTFHPPTLDLLDRFGISNELVEQGLVCPTWQIRLHPSGERAVFDLSVLGDETAHPYRLQCEQWRLSRALLRRLANYANVTVRFQSRVTAVSQSDSGVLMTVEHDGETWQVTGQFAIGCDGARSVVRQSMSVAFDGSTYPETTILATTSFPFHTALPGLSNVSYCWKERGGNFSLLRLANVWRVSIYPDENRSIEESLRPAAIAASLGEIAAEAAIAPVLEVRPYRVHQRIASNYRLGRLVLAGDAAHLNSPAGGMGMNGGVHDAFNLADKLIRIWRGEAHTLLDVYERQRQPIAREQIIAQADANRSRMRERDPGKRREILAGLQQIIADPTRLHAHLLKTSMIAGLRQAAAIS